MRELKKDRMAIFSMFFGSGNAIFPLDLGVKLGTQTPWGLGGLFSSAILLPFIGLVSITFYFNSDKITDSSELIVNLHLPTFLFNLKL